MRTCHRCERPIHSIDSSGKYICYFCNAVTWFCVQCGARITSCPPGITPICSSCYQKNHPEESVSEDRGWSNCIVKPKEEEPVPETSIPMVLIQSGSFTMGSDKFDSHSAVIGGESPAFQVCIPRSFWVGIYPIIEKDVADFLKIPSSNWPLTDVSWDRAIWLCNLLSERDGYSHHYDCLFEGDIQDNSFKLTAWAPRPGANGYRLLSEEEWEYACRAGTTTDHYGGDLIGSMGEDPGVDRIAWYDENSDGATHPVGEKEPNAWGLYDMLGNIWEWTCGQASEYPLTFLHGDLDRNRIVRGGSYECTATTMRSSRRISLSRSTNSRGLGFRVCRDARK